MSDCIIVGGGIIGMLSALALHERGLSVRILERHRTGEESSWAGGGILSPIYPWRYADAVNALAQWSQARYQHTCSTLHQHTGIDPEWTQSGLLMLDCDEHVAAHDWATHHGAALEQIGADEIYRCEPALGTADARALWMPAIAQLRNPRMLQALRKRLDQVGIDVAENCEVTGFDIHAGQLRGVVTRGQTFHTACAVVAGGAWSQQLLQSVDRAIDVAPVRGQMLLLRAAPGLLTRIVLRQGRYLIPRRDGHILVGSTVEHSGYDKSTTTAARDELHQIALELVPALRQAEVAGQWAGLRPGAPEGIPYIGAIPDMAGLYVNAGQFRNGVVTGLASAQLLADLITGHTPIVDPTAYAPANRHHTAADRWF